MTEYSVEVRDAAAYRAFAHRTAYELLIDWNKFVQTERAGKASTAEWQLLADTIESALLGAREWTPALVAQGTEQGSSKAEVEGSNPSERTTEPSP